MRPSRLDQLREQSHRACERYRADRFAWFPAWMKAEDPATLHRRPLAYCGRTHAFWTFLRDARRQGLDVRCVVDDTAAGTACDRVPVLTTAEWVRLAKQTPELVAVNCPLYFLSGKLHFELAAATHGLRLLNWVEWLRLPGFAHLANGTLNDFVGDPQTSVQGFFEVEPLLEDELSKLTLYSILLYRLTQQDRFILDVVHALDSEYFFGGLFDLAEDEAFVDAGAFDGDTLKKFVRLTRNRFRRYDGFEPDRANFEKLVACGQAMLGEDPRARFHRAGLWERSTELTFRETSEMGSTLAGDAASASAMPQWNISSAKALEPKVTQVKVLALDEVLQDRAPTFLKMDIEGAEQQALRGASQTIRAQRPRLAISAYHLPGDIPALARQVRALVPEYRLALRHHWAAGVDTVLYACVP